MRPLTHAEARVRAELITVDQMSLELDLTGVEDFASRATITFACSEPGAETFVDCHASAVTAITLNGEAVDPSCWEDGRIALAGLAENNELVVDAVMAYSHDGEGLVRHVDPADRQVYLYAMSFLDAAPRWFACFDQPDIKAPYEMRILAPAEWIVFGTGTATRVLTSGEVGEWLVEQPVPISSYVVAIAAGPYVGVVAAHDGIVLGVHARASLADELSRAAGDILDVTRRSFDRYHELFGLRYPFGNYHQVFVPDFNAGAMENPGCIILRDSMLFRGASTNAARGMRAATIAHEMAHQWFGDLVTMRWWDNLWLNESFAEYMGHRICEDVTDYPQWVGFGLSRKFSGMVADQSPSTHPVAAGDVEDAYAALENFDSISYSKGAALLRQLNALIGDDVFFAGLRLYFQRHAQANAEIDDLLGAWEEAGAQDLGPWRRSWLGTSGMDRLEMRVHGDAVFLDVSGAEADREHAIEVIALDDDGQVLQRDQVVVSTPGREVATHIPGAAWFPDGADLAWGNRRPSLPWSQMPLISRVSDGLTRAAMHASVCDTVHNGEITPAAALDVICANAATEPDDAILRYLLHTAIGYCQGMMRPKDRPVQRARIAAMAEELYRTAEPGSDRQLLSLRALLETSDDVTQLQGMLRGSGLADGIELDVDLRWSVLTRLSMLGAGADLIDAELARDTSPSALVAATKARACAPDLSAKERAYDVVMHDVLGRPDVVYAAAAGLFLAEQEDLVVPLALQWFDDLAHLSTVRSGWLLNRTVLASFPVEISTDEILAAARRTLGENSLHPLVRRAVMDRTDELERKNLLRKM